MKQLKCNYKFPISYYHLVFLGYILTLFLPGFRCGLFAAAIMVLVAIEAGISVIKSDKKSDFISLLNVCVLLYLIYNLFSCVWIVKNGFPISIYVEEFSNSILPAVFYFVPVLMFSTKGDECGKSIEKIYKSFLLAFSIYSFICIVMYLWAPQFYCDFLLRIGMISKADASTCRVRMEGFTGSTSISYLGVAAMLVATRFMYKHASALQNKNIGINKLDASCSNIQNNSGVLGSRNSVIGSNAQNNSGVSGVDNKNNKLGNAMFNSKSAYADGKNKNIKQLAIYSLAFVFSLIVVFLANGRAGMVAALLVIVYINILVFPVFKFADKKYLYYEAIAVVALIVIMCIITPGIAAKIWVRLVSLSGAVGQRSEQWVSAINNMYGQWFGNGLGANGHKAIGIEGAHVVPDGGIVKLYCEEGALGFSLFVFILLVIFRHGIKDIKKYFAELGIIATALLMSIGSNIIAFQLCMPIFWYAAGVVGMDVIGNATGDTDRGNVADTVDENVIGNVTGEADRNNTARSVDALDTDVSENETEEEN